MRTLKAALPAALAVGAIALLPGTAGAEPASKRAHAAGGDAPPVVLPTAVRVRIKRGENALDRAADYVDRDMPDKATASLKNARRNMYAAWRSAVYIVENAPPPPPPGDGKAVAHSSGAAAGPPGTNYATPEQTAVAVLGYQHDVVGASFGLIDGAKGTLRDQVSTTIFAALDRRDSAVTYIHNRPVPPPAEDGKAIAHAAGGAVVASSFAQLMPAIPSDLNDEIQQGKELRLGGALTAGEKRVVLLASAQISDTKDTINNYWPPAPAGD